MDSLSHIAMGTGIVAISHISPEIVQSENRGLFLLGAIIASIIPDFDVVMKAKGQDKFLMIHRGKSHSIFLILIASALFAYVFSFFLDIPLWMVVTVFTVSTAMHIFMDLFNNYGTQFLWPIKRRWYAWSFTNTADYLIHVSHFIGLGLWAFTEIDPVIIFSTIYILFAIYFVILYFTRKNLKQKVKLKYFLEDVKKVWLISKSLPHQWKYICETSDNYFVGTVHGNKIAEYDVKVKDERLPESYFKILKNDIAYKNFVDFSRVYYWEKKELKNGITRIKYTDLRYLNDKGHYTFSVVFDFEKDMTYARHIGWVFNQPALERKMTKQLLKNRRKR